MASEARNDDTLPQITLPPPTGTESLFDDALLALLADLGRQFRAPVDRILENRQAVQARLDAGGTLDFPAATRAIRESDWTVAPIPADLQDRRVEITGPVDRKMIINALNSGARVFMADFEDSSTPSWENMVHGQQNLHDAVRRTIEFTAPNGKQYALNDDPAVLIARPRGWHLDEKHVVVDGRAIPGGLFDAACYVFHNARTLLRTARDLTCTCRSWRTGTKRNSGRMPCPGSSRPSASNPARSRSRC
jgi:malate synthase